MAPTETLMYISSSLRRPLSSLMALLLLLIYCVLVCSLYISPTRAATALPSCNVSGLWTYNSGSAQFFWEETEASLVRFNASFEDFEGLTGSSDGNEMWTHAQGSVSLQGNLISLEFFFLGGTDPEFHNGLIDDSCDFIILDNEWTFVRVFPSSAQGWLAGQTASLLRMARAQNAQDVVYLTPGYPISYEGQWMRDSFYGFSSAWDLLPNATQAMVSAEYLFSLQRESDGMFPISVDFLGIPSYEIYVDKKVLDSASFAVLMASTFFEKLSSNASLAFTERNVARLVRGMEAVPLSEEGLVWSDPASPSVGYGFTDTVTKSGNLLYSSLLYFDACIRLAVMLNATNQPELAAVFEAKAQNVRTNISLLWEDDIGLFLATSVVEASVYDIWGSVYADYLGLLTPGQSELMFNYITTNSGLIFFEGQVREMPLPQHWEKLFRYGDPRKLKYQNGGYWATPNHHMLLFLSKHDPLLACELLDQNIASFMSHGINEWIGPFWPADCVGAPGYIASAANTYFASKNLECSNNGKGKRKENFVKRSKLARSIF